VARHLLHLFTGDPATLRDATDRSLYVRCAAPALAAIGLAALLGASAARAPAAPQPGKGASG